MDAEDPTVPTDTTGKGAQLDFLNRYQLDKELAMIRAFRSHPSVSIWTLQNETSFDLTNPAHLLRLEQNAPGRSFEDDPAEVRCQGGQPGMDAAI